MKSKYWNFRFVFFVRIVFFIVAAASQYAWSGQVDRILVIGNSMTWHKPKPDIGWLGDWGMAATERDFDFSHRLASMVEEFQNGKAPVLYPKTVYGFEQNLPAFNLDQQFDFVDGYSPDMVVVFVGDNVKIDLFGDVDFYKKYLDLLSKVVGSKRGRLFCVSTWWPNKKLDGIISKACGIKGGVFVDISEISKQPGMKATSTGMFSNAGVAAHPSDRGMEAIASAIFGAFKKGIK